LYLERAAASRAERCERRRACGSRAGGGRAAARLERAAASRAERAAARAGGVAGGAGGRRARAAALGERGARGFKGRTLPPVQPAVGAYRRMIRR